MSPEKTQLNENEKIRNVEADESEAEEMGDKAEIYKELMDKLESIEARIRVNSVEDKVKGRQSEEDIDEAVMEEDKDEPLIPPNVDPEQLSNSQLVQLMVDILDKTLAKVSLPVLTKIETLRVKEELREAREKYEDFDQMVDAVYAICRAKPTLSIDEAYHIAKGAESAKGSKKQKTESKSDEKTSTSQQARPVYGEKPRMSSKTAPTTPKTVEEAVTAAFEQVMKS